MGSKATTNNFLFCPSFKYFFLFTAHSVSRESGEDQSAAGLLLRTYSAGPVFQTCYYLKGESCYAL
jgi:hypothetical protein